VAAKSLLLLAFLTAALLALQNFVTIETVTLIYLIAVLFVATRGGAIPAIVTALGAIGAAAFFFYPPIYDFRVHSSVHLIDIAQFIVVAVVTGKLAIDARRAKLREQADALREALIGSVSHELRSPLSSIVGSPRSWQSRRRSLPTRALSLVHGVQEEADRLNDHIQNLLDSTRISSEGVRPLAEWVDPGGRRCRCSCRCPKARGLSSPRLRSSDVHQAFGGQRNLVRPILRTAGRRRASRRRRRRPAP
jgi:K+-sensing histidine kinase KdpD